MSSATHGRKGAFGGGLRQITLVGVLILALAMLQRRWISGGLAVLLLAISLLLAFGTGLHKQMIRATAGLGDRIVIAWPG